MSCPDSTAPIDIVHDRIAGKCDLKCSFSFQYGNSSCTATNRRNYLSLSYDGKTNAHVQWNQSAYNLTEVRLYQPSLHSYGGQRVEGEAVLMHTSQMGLAPLFVCIPIVEGGYGGGGASATLQAILANCAKKVPEEGDRASLQLRNYSMDDWVPRSPFYSYTATEMFQPCSATVDYVVFDPSLTPLSVRRDLLETWSSIAESHSYSVAGAGVGSVSLFYNANGPNVASSTGNDDIYIDCQPVGASEETELQVSGGSGGGSGSSGSFWKSKGWKEWMNNPAFITVMVAFGIFLCLFGIKRGYEWMSGSSAGAGAVKGIGLMATANAVMGRKQARNQDTRIVG